MRFYKLQALYYCFLESLGRYHRPRLLENFDIRKPRGGLIFSVSESGFSCSFSSSSGKELFSGDDPISLGP